MGLNSEIKNLFSRSNNVLSLTEENLLRQSDKKFVHIVFQNTGRVDKLAVKCHGHVFPI